MKYVQFTGEYTKLKTIGFKFQKLFANNYLQWNSGDYRVWKKGNDITNDRFTDAEFASIVEILSTLDMNNLPFVESNYIKGQFYIYVYIHRETSTCTFDMTDWRIGLKMEQESYNDDDVEDYDNPWKKIFLGRDSLQPLIQLAKLGWVKVAYDGKYKF